ncbi:hypothetical protein ACIPSE_19510 [Streptomyces sp. NPDC090106]|uniref:hypothetical protein n=1 Tax=Streptomyces sp. NPDC090106 TaxID=3365946 RepID=UPI0038161334
MKLGKVLATGVAEERPRTDEPETGIAEVTEIPGTVAESEAVRAPEEVPAAR